MAVMDGKEAQLLCAVRGSPLPKVVWLREESDVVFEEGNEEVSVLDDDDDYDDDDGSVMLSIRMLNVM